MSEKLLLCECGCNGYVKSKRRRFIHGHHNRGRKFTDEHRKKLSLARIGKSPVNKGKSCSEEQKKKISETLSGRVLSEKHKKNISFGMKKALLDPIKRKAMTCKKVSGFKGRKHTEESRKLIGLRNLGRKHTEEQIEKMKATMMKPEVNIPRIEKIKKAMNSYEVLEKISGSNASNWKGGISNELYCDEWIDKEYRKDIKERDNYTCQNFDCKGNSKRLCIHHIDYNKKNCKPDNLITVCVNCNSKANRNREYWEIFYKNIIRKTITCKKN